MEQAKILIVDDEDHLRRTLGRFLKMEGYSVSMAADGSEALALARRDCFHVVLLDLKMPGMPGLEVLRRFKTEHAGTVVIVITGMGDIDVTRDEVLAEGADAFLLKPCKLDALAETIATSLRHEGTFVPK